MGVLLGAAQGWAVRLRLSGVRRWAGWSALGWALAMPVVFVGATTVGATWSVPAVAATGAATGLLAGTVLGLVTLPGVGFLGDAGAPYRPAPRERGPRAP